MSAAPRKTKGLVLAGGLSSRMGTDKASLVHADGRNLARRCGDLLLESGCAEVVLSLRADQAIPDGFDDLSEVAVVRDPAGESCGPLVGILTGMLLDPSADWLVVACDLPRLDAGTLVALIREKREGELFLAYRSESDGLPEPLCALYAHEALPILVEARAMDRRGPRKILMEHDCRLIDPITPGALENANTPEDWHHAMSHEAIPEWQAELLQIFISPGNDFKGRHGLGRLHHGIQELTEVECVAGKGLVGDRYFDFKPNFKGQVTFFSAAILRGAREKFDLPDLSAHLFRRNLIVDGLNPGHWIGKRFRFQGVEFEGSEECKPCYWMDETVAPGMEAFLTADSGGGLRARILTSGTLKIKA